MIKNDILIIFFKKNFMVIQQIEVVVKGQF